MKRRKNTAAQALARKRWAGSTADERKAFSEQGASLGGSNAWAGMSEEERSEENKRRAAKRKRRP
jgi:hypothetical protein